LERRISVKVKIKEPCIVKGKGIVKRGTVVEVPDIDGKLMIAQKIAEKASADSKPAGK